MRTFLNSVVRDARWVIVTAIIVVACLNLPWRGSGIPDGTLTPTVIGGSK